MATKKFQVTEDDFNEVVSILQRQVTKISELQDRVNSLEKKFVTSPKANHIPKDGETWLVRFPEDNVLQEMYIRNIKERVVQFLINSTRSEPASKYTLQWILLTDIEFIEKLRD